MAEKHVMQFENRKIFCYLLSLGASNIIPLQYEQLKQQ